METLLKKATQNRSAREYKEGPVAKTIEDKTARFLPSDLFLWSALGAMGASLVMKIMGKDNMSLFVGQWPAAFLIMGLYNKIVKVEGHD